MNQLIKHIILTANILLFAFSFPQSLYSQEMKGTFVMSSVGGLQNLSMDIFNPNRAVQTPHVGNMSDVNTGYAFSLGGEVANTNQFTGFQLYTSAGTATVEYQVFGYREA